MRFVFAAFFSFWIGVALGAPADDGQIAGARTWILDQPRLGVAITPDDANDLAIAPTRFLYTAGVVTTGAACVIVVRLADGGTTNLTFSFFAPGVLHRMEVKRVLATGTTCTGILALY